MVDAEMHFKTVFRFRLRVFHDACLQKIHNPNIPIKFCGSTLDFKTGVVRVSPLGHLVTTM